MADESKCAMITGAAGGIGIALAARLVRDGWQLHLCDVNLQRLQAMRETLPDSTTICASMLDTPQACASVLPDSPNKIDALIHLAGIFEYHDLDATGRAAHDRTIQHNATNAYDLSAAIEPRLPEGGRIVFTSSLAFNRGVPDNISYSMAKGALVGLTRSLSRRLAPKGILVNAIAPGLIETPMLTEVMTQRDEKNTYASIPLGRPGKAGEVAGVVAFLLSEDASYVTGQLINIDGGVINS